MARTSKPNCLSVIPYPVRIAGRSYMSYDVSLAFPFLEAGVLFAEVDIWKMLAPYLPLIQSPAIGEPKSRGEWMLAGSTYAPDGLQRSWEPDVQIGDLRKRLRVHGPRRWEREQLTVAEPVGQVEIRWENAWGGPGAPENRAGCGTRLVSGEVSVPCIEMPNDPWRHPDQASVPAGTLPVDGWHPQRREFAGTYGADYLSSFFPGMPADFDRRFFNRAPKDQQLEGAWSGDETFVLRHWHPQHACIEDRLPGLRVALHTAYQGAPLKRVDTQLTTVWFFPEIMTGVLVFNGWIPSSTLDGSDIERVIAGVELMNTSPLDVTHYESVWRSRTEQTAEAAARALDDGNLCPPDWITRFTSLDTAMSRVKPSPALTRMGERMSRRWLAAADDLQEMRTILDQGIKQSARKDGLASGESTDWSVVEKLQQSFREMASRCEAVGTMNLQKKPHEILEDIKKTHAATMTEVKHIKAQLETKRINSLSDINIESFNSDWENLKRKLPDRGAEVQSPSKIRDTVLINPLSVKHSKIEQKEALSIIDANLVRDSLNQLDTLIEQQKVGGPDTEKIAQQVKWAKRLKQQVESMGDEHADGAQRFVETLHAYSAIAPEAPALPEQRDDEDWAAFSERFLKEAKRPEFKQLNDQELITPDFPEDSPIRLRKRTVGNWRMRNLDLRGAVIENMTFIACDFRGCDLTGSTWQNSTLIGCDLSEANLQDARFEQVAVHWSCLDAARAARSHWAMSRFLYGRGRGVDWNHSRWTGSMVLGMDFTDTKWSFCDFTRVIVNESTFGSSIFSNCRAIQASWSQSALQDTVWEQCTIERCNFAMSQLPRVWCKASLTHVCLRETQMMGGDWRDARMKGVDFGGAILSNSDFSGLEAEGIQMLQADLRGSNFSRATIENGLLIGADLRGSRFSSASLSHCWLGLTMQDDQTDFSGVDLQSCNIHPKLEQVLK